MDLLNRYLQAVKFWLPKAQQDDIIAELRDDIRSEIEERETDLGRSLNESELEAILKQRGRPLLVAEKYLPQRALIGPVLFPAYWFVLRLVMLCYLVPWIFVWIGLVLFNQHYRMQHLGPAVVGDIYVLWVNALVSFTVVTIIFGVLERVKDKNWLVHDWSPRKLPPVRDTQRIPRSGSAIEFIMGLIFGIWWLRVVWTLTVLDNDSLRISLMPAWHRLFWAFLSLVLVNAALSAFNFVRPYWTRARHAVKAMSSFGSAAIFSVILKIQPMVVVNYPAGPAHAVVAAVNLGLAISFAIAVVIAIVIGCVELWRIYSISQQHGGIPKQAVA